MHLISIAILLLSFIYKTETQGVSDDVQEVLETLPLIPAEPDLQELPIIPVEPEIPTLPILPVESEPVLQELPIIPVQPELPVLPVQPELPIIPVQPELPIIPTQPLPILPTQPLPTLPILPVEPELPIIPEPEPNDDLEHSSPESISSAEIIRKNGEAIKNYLNSKFQDMILIATEIRVLILADFITVYSDLEFGPDISNLTIVDYCEEFKHQIEVISNRTFGTCDLPEGTIYKPGNVVTMEIQSAPPSNVSGAIGLACSILILALSSVFLHHL